MSELSDKLITDAFQNGKALLKFISRNDTGATGSHQCGFYLPKQAWQLYTTNPPTIGQNAGQEVEIVWHDGTTTNSMVKWYGQGTRSEYRLTRFGRGFRWLNEDQVGNLFTLIPQSTGGYNAYVLETEDEIGEVLAALGVEPFNHWAVFEPGQIHETVEDCLLEKFNAFARAITALPTGDEMSEKAKIFLQECNRGFSSLGLDDVLLRLCETEYGLFRHIERKIYEPAIGQPFTDLENFLSLAKSIINSRKSRAGRSLENHVDFCLTEQSVPHIMRPPTIEGRPDIIIPDMASYNDISYPEERLFMVGVKTTCKDRWRQVLKEAPRVQKKYILTLQPGISSNQLSEMHAANVSLVIPQKLHREYPSSRVIEILTVEQFVDRTRTVLQL